MLPTKARYVLIAVGAALAACSAFGGSDTAPPADQDGGASANDGATSADVMVLPDAGNPIVGDASTTPDANAGGFVPYGTSSCKNVPPGTLLCADFDESPSVDAGWTLQSFAAGGIVALGPTLSGGSAPNALSLVTQGSKGVALVDTTTFSLLPFASRHVLVRFAFSAVPGGGSNKNISVAGLILGGSPIPIYVTVVGELLCAGTNTILGAGTHTLLLDVTVKPDGTAGSFVCTLDGQLGSPQSFVGAWTDLALELGEHSSASATALTVDDLLMYSPP